MATKKIKMSQLKKIIKEELDNALREQELSPGNYLKNTPGVLDKLANLASHQGVDAVLGGAKTAKLGMAMGQKELEALKQLVAPMGVKVDVDNEGYIMVSGDPQILAGIRALPYIAPLAKTDKTMFDSKLGKYFPL